MKKEWITRERWILPVEVKAIGYLYLSRSIVERHLSDFHLSHHGNYSRGTQVPFQFSWCLAAWAPLGFKYVIQGRFGHWSISIMEGQYAWCGVFSTHCLFHRGCSSRCCCWFPCQRMWGYSRSPATKLTIEPPVTCLLESSSNQTTLAVRC